VKQLELPSTEEIELAYPLAEGQNWYLYPAERLQISKVDKSAGEDAIVTFRIVRLDGKPHPNDSWTHTYFSDLEGFLNCNDAHLVV